MFRHSKSRNFTNMFKQLNKYFFIHRNSFIFDLSPKHSAMKKITIALLWLNAFSFLKAQDSLNNKKNLSFKFTVEAAPEWTSLFERTSGWFGADGIFSIPLSGVDKNNNEGNDSTLLLFGDTYIGEVKHGKPISGNTMVNNTIAYIKGNDPDPSKIHFLYKQAADGTPQTFFVPQTSTKEKPQ